jgi:hypothetical protein
VTAKLEHVHVAHGELGTGRQIRLQVVLLIRDRSWFVPSGLWIHPGFKSWNLWIHPGSSYWNLWIHPGFQSWNLWIHPSSRSWNFSGFVTFPILTLRDSSSCFRCIVFEEQEAPRALCRKRERGEPPNSVLDGLHVSRPSRAISAGERAVEDPDRLDDEADNHYRDLRPFPESGSVTVRRTPSGHEYHLLPYDQARPRSRALPPISVGSYAIEMTTWKVMVPRP